MRSRSVSSFRNRLKASICPSRFSARPGASRRSRAWTWIDSRLICIRRETQQEVYRGTALYLPVRKESPSTAFTATEGKDHAKCENLQTCRERGDCRHNCNCRSTSSIPERRPLNGPRPAVAPDSSSSRRNRQFCALLRRGHEVVEVRRGPGR